MSDSAPLTGEATSLQQIAPRLARAHRAERQYQTRLAAARRNGGLLPLDIASEEMIRSVRAGLRHGITIIEAMRAIRRG